MEFYITRLDLLKDIQEFQFPTGWNSTQNRQQPLKCHLVSIPNGMEFYRGYTTLGSFDDSFNSQWDGILRSINQSIIDDSRFNSQRDGILQKIKRTRIYFVAFQFPTGWNSTHSVRFFIRLFGLFQFPTGWNSTGMDKNFRRLARDVSIPKEIDYSPNLY